MRERVVTFALVRLANSASTDGVDDNVRTHERETVNGLLAMTRVTRVNIVYVSRIDDESKRSTAALYQCIHFNRSRLISHTLLGHSFLIKFLLFANSHTM
jgi:hypothetical protein